MKKKNQKYKKCQKAKISISKIKILKIKNIKHKKYQKPSSCSDSSTNFVLWLGMSNRQLKSPAMIRGLSVLLCVICWPSSSIISIAVSLG